MCSMQSVNKVLSLSFSDAVTDDEDFFYSEEALDVVVEAMRVHATFVTNSV